MVAGEDARTLWDGVRHAAGKCLVVLDLAQVNAIDAAGLGLLTFFTRWHPGGNGAEADKPHPADSKTAGIHFRFADQPARSFLLA